MTVTVNGAVAAPLTLDSTSLAAATASVTVTVGGSTYVGASVYGLLSAAHFAYPTGGTVKNGFLRDYVVVTGTGGASAVLSEGEVDPGFGGAASTDIIAYSRDGVAIAPTLVLTGDANGGAGGRSVSGVTSLFVGVAPVPAALTGTPAASAVTVGGDLPGGSTTYTAATLQPIAAATQTDSYAAGANQTTLTFTGVPISTLLSLGGLSQAALAGDYVVATGSDGYGTVYSGSELSASSRTGATALASYSDGSSLSTGGVAGAVRTTAPGDAKGGRYVSGLASLQVANPNDDTIFRLYEGALNRAPDAPGMTFWSNLLPSLTLSQAAAGFLGSAEYQAHGGAGLSNTDFVASLYQQELGRAADTGGASYWQGLLAGGTSRADVLASFTTAPESILHNAVVEGLAGRTLA